eukprot:CAMPEP_0168364996 /NCGR_PEP_ID=MMETSP0228-20121227/4493_1 /TAXON_ID=133427 /ORGANISM="Protoceratium reticulatum, Strain CCCM 535 (=CCMP 1889)" /LENGTH=433 /DNA_ID=CAMNT_0008377769 /DNA_START=81 /DNA_END=1378 /DNA_ORIENTATION=+
MPCEVFPLDEADALGRQVLAEDRALHVLENLHGRTAPWPCGTASETAIYQRRYAMVGWLVRFFEKRGMRDSWLSASVALLDTAIAARSQARRPMEAWGHADDVAEAHACALLALKLSPAETEFDMGVKDLVLWDSAPEQAWPLILRHEKRLCGLLGFRLARPSCHDLCQQLAAELQLEAEAASRGWPGLAPGELPAPSPHLRAPQPRLSILMAFLAELSLLHLPAPGGAGCTQPGLLAVAVAWLALRAFPGVPDRCISYLRAVQRELLGAEAAERLHEVTHALHKLWSQPPRRSPVVRKWAHRVKLMGGPLPGAPETLLDAQELPAPKTPEARRCLGRQPSSTPCAKGTPPCEVGERGPDAGGPGSTEEPQCMGPGSKFATEHCHGLAAEVEEGAKAPRSVELPGTGMPEPESHAVQPADADLSRPEPGLAPA